MNKSIKLITVNYSINSHIVKVLNNVEHIMQVPLNLLLNKCFIMSLSYAIRDIDKDKYDYIRNALKQCPIIDLKLFDSIGNINL